MFEIFGPIFEQNVTINFEPIFEQNANFGPIFEKSAYFGPIFEKSVNFEHFVNGKWSHYKVKSTMHNGILRPASVKGVDNLGQIAK